MTSYCRGVILTYFFHSEICMPADYSNVDRPAFIQYLATLTLPAVWGAWQYLCPSSKSNCRSYRHRWRTLIASMAAIMGAKQHRLPWNTGILRDCKVYNEFANNMPVSGLNSWWYISFVFTALGFMSISWLWIIVLLWFLFHHHQWDLTTQWMKIWTHWGLPLLSGSKLIFKIILRSLRVSYACSVHFPPLPSTCISPISAFNRLAKLP